MAKGHIVAMGAGRAIMERPHDPLHEYILTLTGTHRPRVLFVPTASGDDASYIVAFYEAYPSRRCEPSHLKLFYREALELRSLILENDIIHVGGGNTANMLAVWRLHGVDAILREAWEVGKVLCGGSAGAICCFEGGVTDSFSTRKLAPLADGLGFLTGSLCPHYDVDELRAPAYRQFVRDGALPDGYAADDQVALHFEGKELRAVLTSREGAHAYTLTTRDGVVEEKPMTPQRL